MEYTNENRGIIQYKDRLRQIIDFSKIRFGNITPTDIDGLIEYRNKAYILYEFKLNGTDIPRGQSLALERMVDDFIKAGKEAVLFLCYHDVENAEEDIIAGNSIVAKFYWHGAWHEARAITVKEYSEKFIQWINSMNWME